MVKFLTTDRHRAWEPVEETWRDDPQLPAAGEIPTILRASQLAAQYGAADLARKGIVRWMGNLTGKGIGPDTAESICDALILAVELAVKNYPQAEEILARLDWAKVPDEPWAVNIRLLAALRANKRSHIVEAIRGRRDCGSHYDRGNCLRILGRWFLQQGSFPRALGFFQAALREYTQDDAMDARLKELAIRGTLGSMAFYDGRFTDAKALLSRAIREAAALRHPFYEYSFRLEIAKLHILNGEPARSREVLEDSLDRLAQRRNTAPIDLFLHIGLLIWAGEAALEMEDSRHAREYARRASVLLQQEDHSRLRANLHVLRARIKSSGRRPLWNEALAELAEAERLHRSIGDGDRLWIHARVALERAKLHVHRRDLRAALASAVECMEMAQATQFVPMQARSLLLQSQLLLQQEMPGADRLYEEVLRSLGAVKDPVILFKVIANLYFYTWHLEGNLDLTDCHLKQIHKMAQVLDRKTFDELYERHVCRRVARRFFAHAFGGDRAAPGNWAADEP